MSTCYTKKQAKNWCTIKMAALKLEAKHKQRLRNQIEDKLIMFRMKREGWL